MEKVSPELQPSCVSIVDPDRPGWYLIHHDGFHYFEPEYAPKNSDTFDEDTSFVIEFDLFFDGFGYRKSLSQPTHYAYAGPDDRSRMGEFEDTVEFKNAASHYVIWQHTKGVSTGMYLSIKINHSINPE